MTFIDKYCMDVQQNLKNKKKAELPDCVERNKMTVLAGVYIFSSILFGRTHVELRYEIPIVKVLPFTTV